MLSSPAARSLLQPRTMAVAALAIGATSAAATSATRAFHCRSFEKKNFGRRSARLADLPDIPVVAPGQENVTVSWTVRNDSRREWPEGVTLQPHHRRRRCAPQPGMAVTDSAVSAPAPGDEAQCSVTFTAPTEPGLHFGVFDLQKPSGLFRNVGRLPVLVEVSSSRDPEESSALVDPDQPREGSRALARLRAAGFTNDARNVRALMLMKGNTSAALSALARMEAREERMASRMAWRAERAERRHARC